MAISRSRMAAQVVVTLCLIVFSTAPARTAVVEAWVQRYSHPWVPWINPENW